MASKPAPRRSVVIPAFNENGNIGPLLDAVECALARRMRFEVIVVDEGNRSTEPLWLARRRL